MYNQRNSGAKKVLVFSLFCMTMFVMLILGIMSFTTIPAGQVGVASVFGKVKQGVMEEGFNIKSPFTAVTLFDARQKTHLEKMGVPSKDQLITSFDISIQYRLIKEMAPSMLKETGSPSEVIEVHMKPLLRSRTREIGKSVAKAEDFYQQDVQQRLQTELLESLSVLSTKGIRIEQLLMRNVELPKLITDAVAKKKQMAQEAEAETEALKKFKVQQERKEAEALAAKKAEVIQAEKKKEVMLIGASAQLEASRIEAEAILVRATAEAEAKKKIIDVMTAEGFIKLEAMKSLEKLANGNHVFIMDPNAATPLPFMNLTDKAMK